MTDELDPDVTATTSSSSKDGYIGFLIFIKILAVLSMIASTFLVRDIYHKLCKKGSSSSPSSKREKLSMVWNISLTQSILVGLSVGDFFSAFFVQFLSTWMVPSNINVAFAAGNIASCTVQGLFSYFFYGLSVFSNASLAVAYCCFVKFGWKDDVHTKYHRLHFTIIPLVCATIISVIPLFGQNYNYNGIFFCDISGSPLGCNYYDNLATDEGGDGGQGECVRGAGSRQMLMYIGVIPFMVAFVIIIAAVSMLIYSVLKQERRMDRFQFAPSPSTNRKMTTQATKRGIYYVGAFGLCWIPWYIYAVVEYKHGGIPDWLGILHLTTMPLQGFLNALVYFRPSYESIRSKHPTESRTSSWFRVLRLSVPLVKNCCCCCCNYCGGEGAKEKKASMPCCREQQDQQPIEGGNPIIDTRLSSTNADQRQLHDDDDDDDDGDDDDDES
ncbi:hypothetical protein ACHAXH_004419 [Discostella pseudostelligera]